MGGQRGGGCGEGLGGGGGGLGGGARKGGIFLSNEENALERISLILVKPLRPALSLFQIQQ